MKDFLERARIALAMLLGRARLESRPPARRPFFDGSAPLGDDERAEYMERSNVLGYVDDGAREPDEGPAVPDELGVALGDQGPARVRR